MRRRRFRRGAPTDFEADLRAEFDAHVAHRADDLEREGLPRAEALRRARLELGSVETHKEAVRDERWFGRGRRALAETARDLRIAARRLMRAPAYAVFAIASIGLGAGVTTAMFSLVQASFWRSAGVADSRRVVVLATNASTPRWDGEVSVADFTDLAAAQSSFSGFDASARLYVSLDTGASTDAVNAEAVTATYLETLGVPAALGRALTAGDDDPRANGAAMLTDACWRKYFAAQPSAIGRGVRIGGAPFEIVGVVPRAFRGLNMASRLGTCVIVPIHQLGRVAVYRSPLVRTTDHAYRTLTVVARLKPGVTLAQASAEMRGRGEVLDGPFPSTIAVGTARGVEQQPAPRRWSVAQMEDAQRIGSIGVPLSAALVLLIGLVLAVASTNLANLALARGTAREQELAVRASLGGSRLRLIRELLAESLLLGAAGLCAAWLVAAPLMQAASSDVAWLTGVTASVDVRPTWAAAVCSIAAVVLALIVCGVWPAVALTRTDLRSVIARGTGAAPPWRTQRALIRAQVIVSVMFLCVSAAFISGTLAQTRWDSGVALNDIVAARSVFRVSNWDPSRRAHAVQAIVAASSARDGVADVAVTSSMPFGSNITVMAAVRTDAGRSAQTTYLIAATDRLFAALGVPVVHGRAFDARDGADAPPVAVISQFAALSLFGSEDVVGRTLLLKGALNAIDTKTEETRTIIGVARETDTGQLTRRRDAGVVYVPIAQRPEPPAFIVARGSSPTALRQLIHDADPDVAIDTVSSGLAMFGGVWVVNRLVAAVALGLGLVTLVLTMAGLSGVMSHVVQRRVQEIGIRKALGASERSVIAMVLKDGARPVIGGAAIGLALGLLLTLAFRAALPINALPVQPLAVAIVVAALAPATLAACIWPARRAARVDVNHTLRV